MEDLSSQLYEERLLVFLETEDVFRQVHLNREQFKVISDAIITGTEKVDNLKEHYEAVTVELDDERVLPLELFEGMNSINI